MSIYRVTFGFSGMGEGWSETHACRDSSTNPVDLVPKCVAVAQKRVTFLGREFIINAIRISRYSDDGSTVRQRGVFLVKQDFANPVQTVSQAAEPAQVALLTRGNTTAAAAPAGFEANTNQTFLGAPPDDAVNNAGVVDTGKANLLANYTQWTTAMLAAQMGWLGSATVANQDINTISQNGDGTVEILTKVALPGGLTIGQTYQGRVRRVNGGVSPLNGQVIVRYTAALTLNTQEIIGLALAQTGGSIRIYKQVDPFIPYTAFNLELVTANHKRGRPFGSKPGRARRRIRG